VNPQMQISFFCDGKCPLSIEVDVQGKKYETEVLIDTGFTTGTRYGLKLGSRVSLLASSIGYDLVRLADSRIVRCASIPDAKLVAINGNRLENPITLPALFFDGPEVIGMQFLQMCKLSVDGPNRNGTLEFIQ